MRATRILRLATVLISLLTSVPVAAATAGPEPAAAELRPLIESMKRADRGPFKRIRWFCNDGAVLPPKPYACSEHGGGRQHGEWSDDTLRVQAAGFPIANVLAELGPEELSGGAAQDRHLRMVLLERFLIAADDGWILRRARYYRGAFQIEDETASADRILAGLAARPEFTNPHYPLLVEAVRLLPSEDEPASAARVRGLATAINQQDPAFVQLRTKIHNRPDPGDAAMVRDYAQRQGKAELAENYATLADGIDALYRLPDPVLLLRGGRTLGGLGAALDAAASRLAASDDAREKIHILTGSMAAIRDGFAALDAPAERVRALRLLLALEAQVFAYAQPVTESLEHAASASRAERVALLSDFARALYGLGLLTAFEHTQLDARLATLRDDQPTLDSYRDVLSYLDRVPGWAGRRLAFYFEDLIEDFAPAEPFAREYIPDRLRGSPLIFYGLVLDALARDAALLGGVQSELFGATTVTGLRPLNPGLGTGVLRTIEELESTGGDTTDTIVIVPQTISELPAVAGILTENEGNALSHVQLLARNLGIPNVVVGAELMPVLRRQTGRRVQLAASPGGIVRLGPATDAPAAAESPQLTIRVDVDKLDLETDRLIPVRELTQADSGVRVGPKAAQLGKLTAEFPGDVSPGLAIPFGLFRDLLDQPREQGGVSTFEWMKSNYAALAEIDDAAERSARTAAFLAELRAWIRTTDLDPALVASVRRQILDHFGDDGSFGVFVRSDTNVEDLPGFTGAGLNLTVPNVTGVDAIIDAIRDVWASPFTERAFGWRQALMDQPEHVYVAVLLHQGVNSDKSGVLITADTKTGDRSLITVVANEGVGGGVDGQSAETLLVGLADGSVTLLNSATAPTKRVLLAEGGSTLAPASGEARLLTDAELDALRAFTRRLAGWFENLPPEERAAVIADVEFGFHEGRLVLFQIRPFVESKGALGNPYLIELDAGLADSAGVRVAMSDRPLEEQQ